jgi:hypothetical protein
MNYNNYCAANATDDSIGVVTAERFAPVHAVLSTANCRASEREQLVQHEAN